MTAQNEILEGIYCEKIDSHMYYLKTDSRVYATVKRIGDSWLMGLWYNEQWVNHPTLYGTLRIASFVAWGCTMHNLYYH